MKKLSMKLDELQVESFETGRETVHEGEGGVKAYYGPGHTQVGCPGQSATTCIQIICDCSAGPSDCDYSCPGYWNAENASCNNC